MEHTRRLECLIGLIQDAQLLLDVGCDHGYVTIEAVRRGRAAAAIAADIGTGPLAAAEEHIAAAGLSAQIKTRQSDGLREITEKPDCIVIAGMGGRLMADILMGKPTTGATESKERAGQQFLHAASILQGAKQILLSPHAEPELVRRAAVDVLGLAIEDEYMVEDGGHFYIILAVSPKADAGVRTEAVKTGNRQGTKDAQKKREEAFYLYGDVLFQKRDQTFYRWLLQQKEKNEQALRRMEQAAETERTRQQRRKIEEELTRLSGMLAGYDNRREA